MWNWIVFQLVQRAAIVRNWQVLAHFNFYMWFSWRAEALVLAFLLCTDYIRLSKGIFCEFLLVIKTEPPWARCSSTLKKSTCFASWISTSWLLLSNNTTWNTRDLFFSGRNSSRLSPFSQSLITLLFVLLKIFKDMWLAHYNNTRFSLENKVENFVFFIQGTHN